MELPELKSALGIPDDTADYDVQLTLYLNAAKDTLRQVDDSELQLESSLADEYELLSVTILFNPPMTGALTAMQECQREMLWRYQQAGIS